MTHIARLVLATVFAFSLAACALDLDPIDPTGDPEPGLEQEEGDRDPTILAAALIGKETALDALVDGFTGARGREPAVSWSGTRYLAVWRDDREGHGSEIYGARIYQTGQVMDRRGFRISTGPGVKSQPTVVWNGTTWVVAWTVDDNIAAAIVQVGDTVTPLGTIAGTAAIEADPALAVSGTGVVLVWQSDSDIRGALFNGTGFDASFAIAATAEIEANPTVTGSNGGSYLVAWQEGGATQNIRAQRVTTAGALDGAVIDVSLDSDAQTVPAATFDGTNYVLAWKSRSDIWGARVSPTGTVLDTTGTVGGVVIGASATPLTNPAVICDPTSCLIAWEDRRDTVNVSTGIYGQRVGLDFALIGTEMLIHDPIRSQNNVALAKRSSGYLAVWDDREVGIHNVSLMRIGADGASLDPTPVLVNRSVYNSQTSPAYALSPTGHLAIWSDSRAYGDDIMAHTYDAAGVKLQTAALTVSNAQYEQTGPAVDFDGANYVVAWADARNETYDVFAARFSQAGTLLDATGIPIHTAARNQLAPAVASGNGVTLIAWDDSSVTANRADIVGTILAQDGTAVAAQFDICRTTDFQEQAAVAWDPVSQVFVVAWADYRNGSVGDIYAARVTPAGIVLDPCGVSVSDAAGDQAAPELASNGAQLLVVWNDYGVDAVGDVQAARLTTANGILELVDVDGIAIATGAGQQSHGTVVGADLGRWGLGWTDFANQTVSGSDIWGNTMLADGSLTGAYVIAGGLEWELAPTFQSGVNTSKRSIMVYQKVFPNLGSTKSMRRRVTH